MNLRLTPMTEGNHFVLRITNTERRTIFAERAGLAMNKHNSPLDPIAWPEVRSDSSGGIWRGEPPLPHTLEPGDPAYPVKAQLYAVRNAFFPDPPRWAWAEDTYGEVYWEEIPEPVQEGVGPRSADGRWRMAQAAPTWRRSGTTGRCGPTTRRIDPI